MLVAVILSTTLALIHHRMQGRQIMEHHLKVMAFNLTTLAVFAVLYALAMYHRHDPRIDAGLVCRVPILHRVCTQIVWSSEAAGHFPIRCLVVLLRLGKPA